VAGYIKPFLPAYLEIPALTFLDRAGYIDKEIRKGKGRWEQQVTTTLTSFGKAPFKKRKFIVSGEPYELDAASPIDGPILVGVDVKRIEARRDIHKRCDEIVRKADKLKSLWPDSRFCAVIYYPFIDEHVNIQNRLRSDKVDVVVFGSETSASIENAVRMMLSQIKYAKRRASQK
jgi:hypothetical protein